MELLLVLGIPLAGSALLALGGHRGRAPEINALMSLLTFVAAAALTTRVIADGPMLAWKEQFFIDAFNVFLVTLTAFVGFTTALCAAVLIFIFFTATVFTAILMTTNFA